MGERIAVHVAHIEAAMHLLLCDLREFDQAGGWERQGAQSCAHWLSWRVGWSLGTAREHVRVANRLAELPEIDDALRRGEVSYSKVRAMTRVATTANESVLLEEARLTTGQQLETICRKYAMVQRHGAEANPDDDKERRHVTRSDTSDGMVRIAAVLHPEEAALVWAALERIVKEGHRGARSGVQGADVPAGTCGERPSSLCRECGGDTASTKSDEFAPSTLIGDTSGDRTDREALTAAHVPAGTSYERPSPCGAPKRDQLDSDFEGGNDPDGESTGRGIPAGTSGGVLAGRRRAEHLGRMARFSRADALVAMAQEILRGARPARSPTELVVTIAADRLQAWREGHHATPNVQPAGADDLSDVGCCADGTAISVDVVRRLACDAGIVAMVEGEPGASMSVGRKTRSIPGAMKRALLQRDHGCRFPGCSNRLFVEGHHVEH
ncbi:MAG: DUF222 domain-containing protein, partial [Kofleriaceae bacterium]